MVMGDRNKKRKFKSQRDAEASLERVWTYGVLRDKMPIRVYKEGSYWYLTSKPKIGDNETEIQEITPEQIEARLKALEGRKKVVRSSGTAYDLRLPAEKVSLVLRLFMTGKYSQTEIAQQVGTSDSTVSAVITNWFKDRDLIKMLNDD